MFRRTTILAAAAATITALAAGNALADGFTTTSGSAPSMSYSYALSDSSSAGVDGFTFGAGYTMSFDTSAGYDTTTDVITASADGSMAVPLTFFGNTVNAFKASANADVDTGTGKAEAGYEVDVLGGVVSTQTWKMPGSMLQVNLAYTFVKVNEDFTIGPVPVTVSAKATGALTLSGSPSYDNGKLGFLVIPGAQVDGNLSAGVGGTFNGVGASAGVEGKLTVLTLSVPLSAASTISSTGVTTKVSGDLTLTAMSGEVDAYAKVCVIACDKWTQEIFNWDGIAWGKSLFSTSNTVTW